MPFAMTCRIGFRTGVIRLRRALLLLLYVLPVVSPFGTGVRAAEPAGPPVSIAVLSFPDRREGDGMDWLGRYLQEALGNALRRTNRAAVLPAETSRLWQRVLGMRGLETPPPDAYERMDVQVIVQGTTQTVLGLTEVRLRLTGPGGDLLPDGIHPFRVRLETEPPDAVLAALLERIQDAVLPETVPTVPASPPDWSGVKRLYSLLGTPADIADPDAWRARIARLEEIARDAPELASRVWLAAAGASLQRAVLHTQEGEPRRRVLRQALAEVNHGLDAAPLDTELQALQAEIHYFLDDRYRAKTEAAVVRIKDPSNGLAHVVLGLVAGLSTGEAAEHFKRALELDPFLSAANRPPGVPPFQGGVLEPMLLRWAELKEKRLAEAHGPEAYQGQLEQGIRLFEAGDYEEAGAVLREAAALMPDDLAAPLYLGRILLRTGRAREAVEHFQQLAAAHPTEPEATYYLGRALEAVGHLDGAEEAYRLALRDRPDDERILYGLATVAMAREDWQEALRRLSNLLNAHPDHVEGWLALGMAHERLGHFADADGAYRQALSLDPSLDAAKAGLRRIGAK